MEVKVIGQMDNTIDHTFESANRVYDTNGCSPTINTCGGGGLQPKIIQEPVCLNSKGGRNGIEGLQPSLQDRVYSTDAVSVAVTTCYMPSILEDKTIVAMRGRYEDGECSGVTHQKLEPNQDGLCNTLTSVQKDNLVMETVRIKQATSQGYIECEIGGVADLSFPDSKTRRGRVQEKGQVSPTLMAGEQDICRIEKEPCVVQKCGDRDKDGKYSIHSYSNCIPANPMSDRGQFLFEPQCRIRKLTPKECWRLMDFADEDFEKAAEVNSATQLYKQAGNSIVRNVLVAIIGQMLEGKENAYK